MSGAGRGAARRRLASLIGIMVLALAPITACAADATTGDTKAPPDPRAAEATDAAASPAEPAVAALQPEMEQAARESEQQLEPARDADPAELIGLDTDRLQRLLGPPRLRRLEEPAQVWQYAHAGCVLDVFLYADAFVANHRVTYYEARSRDGEIIDGRRCFTGLVNAKLGAPDPL